MRVALILSLARTNVASFDRPGNLAYATRLGLWGAHSPFGGFKDFKENMEKRGIGALEMLAMELKAKGSYLSRGLGWRGAEFETCEVRWVRSECEHVPRTAYSSFEHSQSGQASETKCVHPSCHGHTCFLFPRVLSAGFCHLARLIEGCQR